MPLVQPGAQQGPQSPKPYGVNMGDNNLTLHERLMKRFKAHEFVMVRNIDDEVLTWQYLPAHAEDVEYTSDPMKITRREMPELWEMAPGDQEALVGANAYLMVNALYKKVVAKRTAPAQEGQATSFNYSDPNQQEQLINEILIGKTAPQFEIQPGVEERDETFQDKVLEAEKSKKVGVAGGSRA
jgi:hypothetical protein